MPPEGNTSFAQALIDPDAPVPAGIVDPNGKPAPKRFSVYRNNVTISLVEALVSTFPAVTALVGEGFFKEMAKLYVRENPPTSPLLAQYGQDFPQYIANFDPAKDLPFLSDVARLDRAWLEAYHAADMVPLAPERLAGVDEQTLVQTSFTSHPAAQLIESRFPVVALWQAGKNGQAAAGIDPNLHQTALLVRPDIEVMLHALTKGEGVFFAHIFAGSSLQEALEHALAQDVEFDLPKSLALLIGTGAVTDFDVQGGQNS